jgi:hypothetical protein
MSETMGPEEKKLKNWLKNTKKEDVKNLQIEMIPQVVTMLPKEMLCQAINEFIEASLSPKSVIETVIPDEVENTTSTTLDVSGNTTSTTEGVSGV